jgi:hypothetical protein
VSKFISARSDKLVQLVLDTNEAITLAPVINAIFTNVCKVFGAATTLAGLEESDSNTRPKKELKRIIKYERSTV